MLYFLRLSVMNPEARGVAACVSIFHAVPDVASLLRGGLSCDSFALGSSCRLLCARVEEHEPPGQTAAEACYVTCDGTKRRSCFEPSPFIVVQEFRLKVCVLAAATTAA